MANSDCLTHTGFVGLGQSFGMTQAGKPSAGKPPAGFDAAGAGDQLTVRLVWHSHRKRGATDRLNLRVMAPVLDPTCERLGVKLPGPTHLVAMCPTESRAKEALRRIGLVMDRLGLTLHPVKTQQVDLRRGKEGFVFLGCTIRKKRSIQRAPDKHYMQRWPSPKATKKLRDRVRELTSKRHSGKDVKQIVAELTPVLRGWGQYFRTGNADREFNKMDYFVVKSLRRWQYRRGGQRPTKRTPFSGDQLYGMGLFKLMGTVKYPAQATPRRSSGSRVPENGTHGLKGEVRNGLVETSTALISTNG